MLNLIKTLIIALNLKAGGEIGVIPRYFPEYRTTGITTYLNIYELYEKDIYLNPYVSYSNFHGIFEQFYVKFDINKHDGSFIYGAGIGIDKLPTWNINRADAHIKIIYKWD